MSANGTLARPAATTAATTTKLSLTRAIQVLTQLELGFHTLDGPGVVGLCVVTSPTGLTARVPSGSVFHVEGYIHTLAANQDYSSLTDAATNYLWGTLTPTRAAGASPTSEDTYVLTLTHNTTGTAPSAYHFLIATLVTAGGVVTSIDNNPVGKFVTSYPYAGYRSISAASGDVTLTAAQYRDRLLRITGTLTANRNINFPVHGFGPWWVTNDTTGDFSLTLKPTSGTGIVLPRGGRCQVASDGTNIILLAGPITSGGLAAPAAGAAVNVTARAGGTLTVNTTAVGNVGTGVDDLITYSVPASVLGTNGDQLEVIAFGEFAANANTKQLKLLFGATTLYDSTALAANAGAWRLRALIIRTGATAQIAITDMVTGNTTVTDIAQYATPAETLSGAVTLKCTGEATANDDIVQRGLIVRWMPV